MQKYHVELASGKWVRISAVNANHALDLAREAFGRITGNYRHRGR